MPDTNPHKPLRQATAFDRVRFLSFLIINLFWTPAVLLAAPVIYQAESGALNGTVVSTALAGYQGTGYVDGFDTAGDYCQVTVTVATAGMYNITFRCADTSGDKTNDLYANGVLQSSVVFPSSSGWVTVSGGMVPLNAGTNTLRLQDNWGWIFLDWFGVEAAALPSLNVSKTLVNANSTAATKCLMGYLVDGYGSRVIAGQVGATDTIWLNTTTGHYPALRGFDMMDYSPSRVAYGVADPMEVENAIAWYQSGGIVQFQWHWNAPTALLNTTAEPWWSGFYSAATTFDLGAALANTASPEYADILRDIDAIAVQLKRLQTAGVPILWRPLHESQGAWFWWGAKGSGPCKQLYALLYDRLTNYHGLNNLIWVWTTQDNAEAANWYPGDSMVDIVGADIYLTGLNYSPSTGMFYNIVNLFGGRKMVAMTENGTLPDPAQMQAQQARWAYFMTWTGFENNTAQNAVTQVQNVFGSAYVTTREELSGVYTCSLGATSTPTRTPTRTATPTSTSTRTSTPTATYSSTPSLTRTATLTSTPTRTFSSTLTTTSTATRTLSSTATATSSPTVTSTSTRTSTSTSTSTPTPTNSPTSTRTSTPTYSSTSSPTPSRTMTPSSTPTATTTSTRTLTSTATSTQTSTPTSTVTSTASRTPTGIPTSTPSPSWTPTRTATSTVTATATGTSTSTPTRTLTATSTVTSSNTGTATSTGVFTSTVTNTPTLTPTPTATATRTSTSIYTSTATWSGTPTGTATGVPTSTVTDTPTWTSTATFTSTATASSTRTSTSTFTSTMTDMDTSTPTETVTDVFTITVTDTSTSVPTATFSATLSSTASHTSTSTSTVTPTSSMTFTSTRTATPTASNTTTVTTTFSSTSTSSPTMTTSWTPTGTPSATASFTPTSTGTSIPVIPTSTPTLGEVPCGPSSLSAAYPNPALGGTRVVRFDLSSPCPTRVDWSIVTVGYRVVLKGSLAFEGTATLTWDLRDGYGKAVADGLYYLLIKDGTGARKRTACLVAR